MQEKCDICLISIDKNIIIGIYINNKLIKTIKKNGRTSDVLSISFYNILKLYKIEKIYYANGPGNFSAIKLTHIFINTLSITLDINTYCIDSFYFTKDKYINAYGKIHFIKNNNEINTITLDKIYETNFYLPKRIYKKDFNINCTPLYILPAL